MSLKTQLLCGFRLFLFKKTVLELGNTAQLADCLQYWLSESIGLKIRFGYYVLPQHNKIVAMIQENGL